MGNADVTIDVNASVTTGVTTAQITGALPPRIRDDVHVFE